MLILFLLALVIATVILWDDAGPAAIILGLLIGTLVSVIFMVCLMPFTGNTVERHDLTTLADGTSTTGSFFLGSGSVNEKPAFYYYKTDADGGSTLEYEYADDVKVYQTENDQPYMEQDCDTYDNIPSVLTFPAVNIFGNEDCYGEIRFYVPEGSIKSQYILDAE